MLHLSSGSALVVEFGLALFCFVDLLIAPESAVRWIPRWAWALSVLAFPICGTILWITAGRPWRSRIRSRHDRPASPGEYIATIVDGTAPRPAVPTAPVPTAPVPDVVLAGELWAVHEEHERTLKLWEASLAQREAALRHSDQPIENAA
jgi:hypothetical protein